MRYKGIIHSTTENKLLSPVYSEVLYHVARGSSKSIMDLSESMNKERTTLNRQLNALEKDKIIALIKEGKKTKPIIEIEYIVKEFVQLLYLQAKVLDHKLNDILHANYAKYYPQNFENEIKNKRLWHHKLLKKEYREKLIKNNHLHEYFLKLFEEMSFYNSNYIQKYNLTIQALFNKIISDTKILPNYDYFYFVQNITNQQLTVLQNKKIIPKKLVNQLLKEQNNIEDSEMFYPFTVINCPLVQTNDLLVYKNIGKPGSKDYLYSYELPNILGMLSLGDPWNAAFLNTRN